MDIRMKPEKKYKRTQRNHHENCLAAKYLLPYLRRPIFAYLLIKVSENAARLYWTTNDWSAAALIA